MEDAMCAADARAQMETGGKFVVRGRAAFEPFVFRDADEPFERVAETGEAFGVVAIDVDAVLAALVAAEAACHAVAEVSEPENARIDESNDRPLPYRRISSCKRHRAHGCAARTMRSMSSG